VQQTRNEETARDYSSRSRIVLPMRSPVLRDYSLEPFLVSCLLHTFLLFKRSKILSRSSRRRSRSDADSDIKGIISGSSGIAVGSNDVVVLPQ